MTGTDFAILAAFGIVAGYISAVFTRALRAHRRRRRSGGRRR